jgi:predicted amidohydrolase
MRDLKVTVIQEELVWEDIEANIAVFDKKLDTLRVKTDLIVLPEMFTSGFSMKAAELAQTMSGPAVTWLLEKADALQADIVSSVIIKEQNCFFNRLLWVKPDGRVMSYDKRHLFRMAGEDKVYTAGNQKLIIELHGWKISPFVCYDLRFPIWTRNLNNVFDVSIFIANWPEVRAHHWKTLLRARSIENQCYTVGVNRVGTDGNNISYSGDSSIIDPLGNISFQSAFTSCIYTSVLSAATLGMVRKQFPVWMDADVDT